ncbi:VCBS domain-containing protein [bacterium SCSIO 12844]|nr:VCBS domain-containing protein [bacterium SCSIO 12844]
MKRMVTGAILLITLNLPFQALGDGDTLTDTITVTSDDGTTKILPLPLQVLMMILPLVATQLVA